MKSALSLNLRSYWAGLKAVLVCTLAVIVYTALMTGIGALGFPEQANGSMITNSEGQIVGSSLIGQSFSDADGEAIDKYFQPRPSAAGDGYDAAASSGANKGHSDEEYLKTIEERRDAIAEREGVDVKQVPADAATASSSGLDPHISPGICGHPGRACGRSPWHGRRRCRTARQGAHHRPWSGLHRRACGQRRHPEPGVGRHGVNPTLRRIGYGAPRMSSGQNWDNP